MDLYRWICTAGFVQLDVQMLYSIKYCVQAGIGWYRLDLPSVGPRGFLKDEAVPYSVRISLPEPGQSPLDNNHHMFTMGGS